MHQRNATDKTKQISNIIYDYSRLFTGISNLEIKYCQLMNWYNISYSSHIKSFFKKLKHQVSGLND